MTPIVLEDFVPNTLADEIEDVLMGVNFNWFLTEDITKPPTREKNETLNPALFHNFLVYDEITQISQVNSDFFKLVKTIYYLLLVKINKLEEYKVLQCRSFLQLPSHKSTPNKKHIDLHIPHFACLYYVNDCDGDTLLYGKKENDDKVSMRITPQKGKIVLFDGQTYHCSSKPTTGPRAIINFDFGLKDAT